MSSAISRLYVQTLDQPLPPQDTDEPEVFQAKIAQLKDLIDKAGSVVVGIGSGLSTASGYDFYHGSQQFEEVFWAFRKAHGFTTLFDGMYHAFATNEEQWAFNVAVAKFADSLPLGTPYRRLARLLEDKDYFILTTNVDGQVPRTFGNDRVWLFQGDMRYMQCSQPCTDKVVHDETFIRELFSSLYLGNNGAPRIPEEFMPRCPECHRLMAPWIRDTNFLEGRLWRRQKASYEKFVEQHLASDKMVLFLELGVSSMTPSIIKLPFWDMTARNENAFYVEINHSEEATPLQLDDCAMVITADLDLALSTLTQAETSREGRSLPWGWL